MRKILFTLILLSLSLTGVRELCAQSFPQPNRRSTGTIVGKNPNVVKLNFLSPFALTANIAYEYFVSPNVSIQLGAYYNGITIERDFLWFDLPSARYRSFAFTPEVRFYTGDPLRPKLNGFYIGPFVRYANTDIKIDASLQENNDQGGDGRTYEGNLSVVRLGAVAGYKFIFNERINLEIFAGPSIRIVNQLDANINTYQAEDFLPFGIALRSGLTIGYGF